MKELTLEELANSNGSRLEDGNVFSPPSGNESLEPVSVADVAKAVVTTDDSENRQKALPDIVSNAFAGLTDVIERKKKMADDMLAKAEEIAEEDALDREMEDLGVDDDESEDDDLTPETNNYDDNYEEDDAVEEDEEDDIVEEVEEEKPKVVKMPKKKAHVKPKEEDDEEDVEDDINKLDNLLDDVDEELASTPEDEEDDETVEERIERFKKSLGSVKYTNDPIDLTKFTIRKKPISSSKILDGVDGTRTKKRFDWALLSTNRSITVEECDGAELDALRKSMDGGNDSNKVILSLKFIYRHIVDANKGTFEEWTKSINTEDVESLYFALYAACYSDSNLLPRIDDETKKTVLVETNIYDMVKYESNEVKEEFAKIRNRDTTTNSSYLEAEMIQISDNFVLSYTPATLYSTFIQYSTLSKNIVDKYTEMLNTMAYIDGFFKIDRENNELVPIMVKEYPNNINKTVISKLKVYAEILKTLSPDQFNLITAKLANIIVNPKIKYVLPKMEHDGIEYEESAIEGGMLSMLFTRAQLAQLKSL